MSHKCYYPEISRENCSLSIKDCDLNRLSGICRVQFVVKTTAREQARHAYCRTLGSIPKEYCTDKGCVSYCGRCEEFMLNYDSIHSMEK